MIDPSAPYAARRAAFLALFKVGDRWRHKESGVVYRVTGVYPSHWGVWMERKLTQVEKRTNEFRRQQGSLGPRDGRYFMTVEHDPDYVRTKRTRYRWDDYTHVSEWEHVA